MKTSAKFSALHADTQADAPDPRSFDAPIYRSLSEATGRRTLLPTPWVLLAPDGTAPVRDVERLCRAAVVAAARSEKPTPPLSPSEFEDTLIHVLGEVDVLRSRYVAAPGREFAPYLFDRTRLRAIDHWRSWFGDKRYSLGGHKRVLGTDPAFGADEYDDDDVDDAGPSLRRSPGAPADPADDWIAAFGGLQPAGDRVDAEAAGELGFGAGLGAPLDARRAGAAQRGRDAGGATRAAYLDCACGWRSYREAPNGLPGWHWPATCVGCGAALGEAAA